MIFAIFFLFSSILNLLKMSFFLRSLPKIALLCTYFWTVLREVFFRFIFSAKIQKEDHPQKLDSPLGLSAMDQKKKVDLGLFWGELNCKQTDPKTLEPSPALIFSPPSPPVGVPPGLHRSVVQLLRDPLVQEQRVRAGPPPTPFGSRTTGRQQTTQIIPREK